MCVCGVCVCAHACVFVCVLYIHNKILFNLEKKGNLAICDSMDGT